MWQELQSAAAKTRALSAMIKSQTQDDQRAFLQDLEYVQCNSPSPKIKQLIVKWSDFTITAGSAGD